MSRSACLLLPVALLLALAACRREPATPPSAPDQAAAPAPAAAPPPLQDLVERDPRYLVGISYPPVANRYPRLAAALRAYAEAAHQELMQAVAGLGEDRPAAPYDLSLAFSELAVTPQLVAIAADGSSYTGGAHGNPLLARFVWLPQQDRQLTVTALIPDPQAWPGIAAYVREQLQTALSQRVDADAPPPEQRAEIVRDASRMIDEGTTPAPENFAQFEPVLDADGRIRALRFVFPPYQVGPYADGVQTVEVPAEVLLPQVAPQYRALFAGG